MLQHQRGTTKGREREEGIVLPRFGSGSCRRTGCVTSCRMFAQHQSGGAYWARKTDLGESFESRGLGELPVTQSSGPASLAAECCTETGGVGCTSCPAPAAHTPPSPSPSLCAFLALPSFLTLSPQKSFLCKEVPPLFEPTPIGSCGSRCAGGEQTPPVGASPLPTCSQP